MRRFTQHSAFLLLTFFFCTVQSFAQITNEADLIKQANKLFEQEKYVEATPLFSQLLSNNPTSPEYNFKYGACLLYSDGEKANGLKNLLFASQNPAVPKECWYFLGKAYHINYQFAEAIKWYKKYEAVATAKDKEKYQVARQIEMCNNGKKLLKNITEMVVIDKVEMSYETFFRRYSMDNIGGQVIVPDELRSDLDKKKEHKIIVHHNSKVSPVVYFASYGPDGKNGLDIYKVNRLPNGDWGKSQIVNGGVNTPYDENYPYMHPDGKTLYFCSKGHNSMGGYDVFRSYYDEESDRFSAPENVDFAISSPDDDLFYVVDSLDRMAWFASARQSENNRIYVYNVRVERIPMMISIVKGKFVSDISPNNLNASIRVEDMANNEVVGIYNTKSSDGSYLITLPKSGKYKFIVTSENSKIAHMGVVEIPYQKELRPLKQELQLVDNSGQEQLRIKNLFDQDVENADAIIAEILKNKGLLNPNASEYNLDSLDRELEKTKTDTESFQLPDNLTDKDLIDLAKKDVAKLEIEAKDIKQQLEAAYFVSDKKNDIAREKSKNAEQLLESLNSITDPEERKQIITDANNLNEESKRASIEAIAAYEVAKNLEEEKRKKDNEVKIASDFAKGIETAINTRNRKEAEKKIREQQDYIRKVMAPEVDKKDVLDELQNKAEAKQQEAKTAMEYALSLRKEEDKTKQDLKVLQQRLDKEKNTNKKKEIQKEIDEKNEELANIQAEIKKAFNKQATLQKEADELASQAAVMSDILSGNITAVLSETEKEKLASDIKSGDADRVIEKNNKILAENVEQGRDNRELENKYIYQNPAFNANTKKAEEIRNIGDEKTRLEEENKNNKSWIGKVDSEIKTLEKEKAKEKDPAKLAEIEQQITTLKDFKSDKEKEIVENEKKISGTQTSVADVKSIDPLYEQRRNEIINSGKPDKEKWTEENKLNQDLVELINDRIKEIDTKITTAESPEKENLQKEKSELEKLRAEKEKSIAENTKRIESSSTSTQVVADINKVDPKYEKKIAEIEKSSGTEEKKLTQKNEAIKTLISIIEKEEEKNNKKLEKAQGEERTKLENQNRELQNLKLEKQREMEDNTKRIEQIKTGVVTSNVTVKTIDPQYEQKLKAIENSNKTEKEKLVEKRDLMDKLIRDIDQQISDKQEKFNFSNGPEKDKLGEELEELKKLKVQQDREREAVDSELKTMASDTVPVENVKATDVYKNSGIPAVDPGYQASIKAVEESGMSPQEKASERIKINKNLLERITEEKRKNESAGTPEKNEELTKLEKDIKALIRQDENTLKGNQPVLTEVEVEKQKSIENSVDPSYENRKNSIENSNKSEIRKTQELRDLNRDFIRRTDLEITKLENDIASGNVKNTEEAEQKLNDLKELRSQKEAELNAENRKLADADIERLDENGRSVSGYAFMPEYSSPEAQKKIDAIQPLIDQIRQTEDQLTELKLRRAESNDEAEKKKLTDQILDLEEKLVKLELEVAVKVEEANKIEKAQLTKSNTAAKSSAVSAGITSENTDFAGAERLLSKSNDKYTEAEALRAQAKKEKDKRKKNFLLMKANVSDQLGNKYLASSEKAFVKSKTGATTAEVKTSITVGDLYLEYYEEMEKANTAPTEKEKLERRIAGNTELIRRIDAEIARLEPNASTDPVAAQKLEKLKTLRAEKLKELETDKKQEAQIAGTVKSVSTDVVKDTYTEEKTFTSEKAKTEIGGIQNQLTEIKKDRAEINALKENRETATPNEQKKLDKAINKAEEEIALKEINVAASFATANANERENQKSILENKRKDAANKDIPANNEMLKQVKALETESDKEFETAAELRKKAATEKDKIKKNELLKEANRHEQKGIDLLNDASRIMETLLGEAVVVENRTNPEIKTDNRILENVAERKSTSEFEIAESKKREADYLLVRAKELEDSATKVKKKYRQAILDDAATKRNRAAELNKEYESLYAVASETKRNEDLQIAAVEQKRVEEERRKDKLEELRKSEDYAAFYGLQNDAVIKQKRADEIEKEIAYQQEIASNLRAEVKDIRRIAATEPDNRRKNELLTQAANLEAQAIQIERKIETLRNDANVARTESNIAKNKSEDYLKSLDKTKADDIRYATNDLKEIPRPEGNYSAPVLTNLTPEEIARKYSTPERVDTEIYAKSEKAVYSKENPIPVDAKQPAGIYYKVQVGAFRNPPPPETFKEFAPISAEKTETGLTRYTVGYFTTLPSATKVRDEVRGIGYRDAFVVAFKDGKRITIAQAEAELAKTNGNAVAYNQQFYPEIKNEVVPENEVKVVEYKNNFVADPTVANYYDPNAARANQVEVIPGLFYTVQVGVYSKPVTPDKLFNISPLNSELTAAKLIRYTSGVFTDFNKANSRKDEIRTIGVSDAFVIAYMNGKRITVAQAKDTVAKYGNSVFVRDEKILSNAVPENRIIEPEVKVIEPEVKVIEPEEKVIRPEDRVIPESANGYKVILGEYQKEIPVRDAEIFLANMSSGIRKVLLTNGTSVYYIDNVSSKEDAIAKANLFIEKGLPNAYVTDKLPGQETSVSDIKPKLGNNVKFQVYVGEFVGEVPPEATEVYLNNFDKGVKRKKKADGTIIYYVLDGPSYDDALKMKAHFIAEGISTVRIVAFDGDKEITLSQAFTSGLKFNVVIGEYKGEMPSEIKEVVDELNGVVVKEKVNEEGFTVCYVENIADFDSALKVKAQFIAEGLSSVQIVANKDGNQISLQEALKIMYE